MSLEFLITTFVIVASPGTGMIYTLAAGLSKGHKASLLAAFSCTLGIIPHMMVALFGLAALLHANPVAFNIMKYAGIGYLLYMAIQTLRERGSLKIDAVEDKRSKSQILLDGILINILNPKLSIFFVAFLPQFISTNETQPIIEMSKLSIVFMLMTFFVFAACGFFAAAMRDHILNKPSILRFMRYSFTAAFCALSLKLAFAK